MEDWAVWNRGNSIRKSKKRRKTLELPMPSWEVLRIKCYKHETCYRCKISIKHRYVILKYAKYPDHYSFLSYDSCYFLRHSYFIFLYFSTQEEYT